MSEHANHLIPDGGWDQRYRDLMDRYDLEHFFFPSTWEIVPLVEGAGGSVTISIARDFWWYRLVGISAIVQTGENDDFAIGPPNYFEIRVLKNGQPLFGTWVDATVFDGDSCKVGLGAGYLLERGSAVTIEWRRIVAIDPEAFGQQKLQWTLEGENLLVKNSERHGVYGWRNAGLWDWDRVAQLQPMMFSDNDELDLSAARNEIRLEAQTGNRDFLLNRVIFYQYPDSPIDDFSSLIFSRLPFDANLYVDQDPLHAKESRIACAAVGGQTSYNPNLFRIPRLVRARSNLVADTGGWPWDRDETVKLGVLWGGYEVVQDRGAGRV